MIGWVKKIKNVFIIGFLFIAIFIIIFFSSACIETNPDQENASDLLYNNSSNNATNSTGDINNTNKTQSNPNSIPLEKPPFIN